MVVSTRTNNKTTHPAAPVMTEAAKRKAGIKTKRRPKKVTKDETIRELRARLAVLEDPGAESFSKDPLFLRADSPSVDMDDDLFEEPGLPTEVDSDGDNDALTMKRKRTSSGGPPDSRALKRSKAYGDLEDVRPTLRNKPSGLKPGWHRTVAGSPTPYRQASSTPTRSSSSSTLAPPTSPDSLLLESDHASSLQAMSPPSKTRSPLFQGDLVPLIDQDATSRGDNKPRVPFTLPRTYKDIDGRKRQPGLRNLPNWLRESFRDRFIRSVIEQVGLSDQPWSNPSLDVLQLELNRVYPTHRIRLHSDDAAVIPTLRDLGVLRNQIGNEGLTAVIEYLPSQYTKRMLGSKDTRAKYIETILADPQRPFIWEYFRPGTIPLARENAYYDQKRRGPFQSEPVLRAFSVYFTAHGIQAEIPSDDPGDGIRPIGALALAATAVERAYRMHLTGDYVSNGSDFSTSNWLPTDRKSVV